MKQAKHKAKKKTPYRFSNKILVGIAAIAVIIIVIFLVLRLQKAPSKNLVATVNGKEITQADIENINLTIPPSQRAAITKKMLVDQAINEALIQQEAAKKGITVSPQEVNERIVASLSKFNMTTDEFAKKLADQNISMDFVKETFSKQLLAFKLFKQTVLQTVNVTESEIAGFYNAYKDKSNATLEESRKDIENIIKMQKSQQAVALYLQQLESAAVIKIY